MTAPLHQFQESGWGWTAQTVGMDWNILDRMEQAVAKVRERLLRATAAFNQAGVPYAVVGENAVASWVATVDEGAVRNTRDIDLLVRRSDLPAITAALEQAGFVGSELVGFVMFRDGAEGKPSEAVHLLFAGEKTRPEHPLPAPEIQTVHDLANFRVIALEALVIMKLMSNRDKDRAPARPDWRAADRRVVAEETAAGIGGSIATDSGHAGGLITSSEGWRHAVARLARRTRLGRGSLALVE